jgi:hypothetical protein
LERGLGRSCGVHREEDSLFKWMEWDVRPTLVGNWPWRRHESLITCAVRARRYDWPKMRPLTQATRSRHVNPSGTGAARISRHKRRTMESLRVHFTPFLVPVLADASQLIHSARSQSKTAIPSVRSVTTR